jgi:multidrug efflux pump subunit AcrB
MNPGVFSVKNDRMVLVAMALAIIGGIVAYLNIGRLEDPEFTIKEALIITPYPGASAEEVAREVTNPIEVAVQQLGQLDRVQSESSRGRSVVSVTIKDRYDKTRMPQVWDELRRKVGDMQAQLPPSVRGQSMVVDDFGDVYGIFLAVTGDGFSFPEQRRYVEFLRRELLQVPGVKSVALFGEQREVVFLEISRRRLAQLGLNEESIYNMLQERNIAADGGRIRVGDQHIPIDPTGAFASADEMLELVIGSDQTGRQLRLRDIATVERGDVDPPRRLLRYDGKPAIGLGISTVPGGNVVTMGKALREKLDQLRVNQPVGIEIGEINFQPEAVSSAVSEFMFNLGKAVTIVFVVLIFAMGRKTGFIIGLVLFLTIMATFLVMYMKGDLLMERISLGALIIALCMLTDNAIIVIEGIKVGIESGRNKLEVVREVVAENQWPLFGATAIGVIAFAAIGLSEDATGEYTNSLFWVILIALTLSWISSVTATPLLSYLFFKPLADAGKPGNPSKSDPYGALPFRVYRKLLVLALRFRWAVVIGCVVAFAAAIVGFRKVDQSFFPPATRPQFMVDAFLPASTHIRQTEAFAGEVQRFIQTQPGRHPRHVLHRRRRTALPARLFARERKPRLRAVPGRCGRSRQDRRVDRGHPEAARRTSPGSQRDREEIPAGARRGRAHTGALQRPGFRGPPPTWRPGHEYPARRWRGVVRAQRLDGTGHGDPPRAARIPGPPQRHHTRRGGPRDREQLRRAHGRLLSRAGQRQRRRVPAGDASAADVARPPIAEREDVGTINSLQIWSPVAGRMIPLNQVTGGSEVVWEDPIVARATVSRR